MKLWVIIVLALFSVFHTRAQTISPKYYRFIKIADSLHNIKEYKNAGLAFSYAFKTLGNKGLIPDRYKAARAWAMAGVMDSAFICLEKIILKKYFTDYKTLISEKDLKPLHDDLRWKRLTDFIKTNHDLGIKMINALKPDTKLPVLNNKVSFVFPAGSHTTVAKRTSGINVNYADRVTDVECNIGDITLSFNIIERMTLAEKKFFKPFHTQKQFLTKVLNDKDGVYSELYLPLDHPVQEIASMLVKMPDGTMFHVSVKTNTNGYPFQDELGLLAEQVLKTMAIESRKTILTEHTESWPIFGTTKSLVATLPTNYGLQQQCSGVINSTELTTFEKYQNYGSRRYSRVRIRTGFLDKNNSGQRYLPDSNKIIIESVNFLGNQVALKFYHRSKNGYQFAEAIIPRDDIIQGFKIHISLMASDDSSTKELIKLIESIKLLPETIINTDKDLDKNENKSGIESLVPNPAQNMVTIQYVLAETKNTAEIILTNSGGEKLKTIPLNNSESKIELDCSAYNSGTYFTILNINGKPIDTKKLVISK